LRENSLQFFTITVGTQIASSFPQRLKIRQRNATGGTAMTLLTRLWLEEDGQGLVEYTLVVLLVAMVFWLGIRDTQVGSSLANGWSRVMNCVNTPLTCSS
jgi:Flp pilus assembly pilin Flp